MDNQTRLRELFDKYLLRRIMQPELDELGILLRDADAEEHLQPQMRMLWDKISEQNIQYPVDWENFYERIITSNQPAVVRKISWKNWIAAASVILIAGITSWYFISKNGMKEQSIQIAQTDIGAPRISKATITLADGKKVIVDSLTNITEGVATIQKTSDGKVVYQAINGQQSAVQYNKFSNPRGSPVQTLTLSDGTRVWMNAASSLIFPTVFIGNERKVQVTGEAYFEVAHDAKKKFIVDADGVTTKVLGTHFNVNCYNDEESIKITLFEGSVEVKNRNLKVRIEPGQQAISNAKLQLTIDESPDLSEVISWKENKFIFNGTDLKRIMRQLARWYDLDVVYEADITDHFTGIISRSVNVSEVIRMLQRTGTMKVRIENKKVYISK